MSFALTKYIFPMNEELVLSPSLGYRLDNPRTEEEIAIVKNCITVSVTERERKPDDSIAPLGIKFNFSLKELNESVGDVPINTEYLLRYYSTNKEKSYIDILAETWVILRFEEDEEFRLAIEDPHNLLSVIISHKETTYNSNFKKLASYCHILSLLSHNNDSDYYGESFLLARTAYDVFVSIYNPVIYESCEKFIGCNNLLKHKTRAKDWLYWIDGVETLKENAEKLETLIVQKNTIEAGKKVRFSQNETPLQKMLHIGNRLKISYEYLQDPELMLLLLVGNIEYLLTRNPDSNRFNIEDSISKQFRLKCGVVIYNQETKTNLTELGNMLQHIYSRRSDLAHGNYKKEIDVESNINYVQQLYRYTRNMINEYIANRPLIDYLKDN